MKIDADIIYQSIEHYGRNTQSIVCMEECAELIQAISKVKRYGIMDIAYRLNLIEEIADVYICLEMLRQMYGIGFADIEEYIDMKQKRIMERMNNDQ